jgi:hypothetical protein
MAGRSGFRLKGLAFLVMLSEYEVFSHGGSLSFKRTTPPTVVLNDTGSPLQPSSTGRPAETEPAPCNSYAPPEYDGSKSNPRSQTLFKSSNNLRVDGVG